MKTNILVLFTAILMLNSCVVVGPKTMHTPLFFEKGEKQIGFSGNTNSGGEVQFDAAFSDRFFIMSDASVLAINNLNAISASFAMGLYKPFGERKRGVLSLYGGSSLTVYGQVLNKQSASIFPKPYLGANIGYRGRLFESAFTLRTGHYSVWRASNWNSIYNTGAIESAGTIRLGGENLKLSMQFGFHYGFDSSQSLGAPFVSLGLTYRFKK